jgi:2,4-dienoyl-CoA reductase-like NADH-dependent reductase (Old Yellow Enzyme family)/thioredoxin reductase
MILENITEEARNMKNENWKLFSPVAIKGVQVKNRIALLPMGNKLQSATGEVTPQLIDFYEGVAKGGAGLVIVQAAYVNDEFGGTRLVIYSDDYVSGLNELAETIKAWGARAGIQIAHPGYQDASKKSVNTLNDRDIENMIEAFGRAAERARRAGFEMVEIHGAHGYLIPQFFSALTNERTDAYGGSWERRTTFPIRVCRKVREAVGEDFPISFRLSGDEFVPGGIRLEDTKKIARILEGEGVDLISLSAGKRPETGEWSIQPMAQPRGCLAHLSQELKPLIHIPVLVAGRINDPVLANSILEEGKADLVGMGRALIADPWLPRKAREGRLPEIRKCLACNYCSGKRLAFELPLKCVVNPEAGRRRETALAPACKKKRALVAGGGPAGMECAYTLHQRGHEVLLFEKTAFLGGKLRVAALPPHKEEIGEFTEFLIRRTRREKIPVFLNYDVAPSTLRDVQPDALVLATGAKALCPSIPGLDKEFCIPAEEALTREPDARRILILGGGRVGCETAEFLAMRGKEVLLIEKLPELAWDVESRTRKLLLKRLLELRPTIHTSTEVVRVEGGRALLRDPKGRESEASFAAIVYAAGFAADDSLLQSLDSVALEIHCIGDASSPRGILDAIHEGHRVGRLIGA